MNDQVSATICIVTAMLVAGLGLTGGCYITEKTKWKAFEAGLVEKQEPSMSSKVYSKP